MANFNDITGWEDELAAYEKTEEGKEHFRTVDLLPSGTAATSRKFPKIPLSYSIELTELMLRHEEIKALLDQEMAWTDLIYKADARDDPITEDHPDYEKMR